MPRKEKKYHFIYKTTNVLSGKYYLGMHSTDNLNDGYMGSGKRLRYSINKYGKDNHKVEILEFVESREDLKIREEEIVNLNEIAKVECMNLVVGGQGGFISLSACTKGGNIACTVSHKITWGRDREKNLKRISEEAKNRAKDPTHKAKLLHNLSLRPKQHSEETKKKMSDSSKGKGKGNSNSQFGKCWITNGEENKKIYIGDDIPEGWRLGRKMKKNLHDN
jgi:hypothetical protein